MKNIVFATTTTVLALLMASISFAASDVTVEWEMTDTTGVTGYKMYYSQDPNMANGIWHQECQAPVENPALSFSMLCTNVNLDTTQTTYFSVAAVTASSEVTSDISTISVSQQAGTLAVVQDFKIEIAGNSSPAPSFNASINFQPDTAPVPDGYLTDSGGSFTTLQGYGWTQMPGSLGTRDRNNTVSPDQSYDTLIHLLPTAIWEISVPNGNYRVTICMGDPSFPSGTPNVQAEGTTVLSGQALSTYNQWIEESTDIQVTDGKLTITFTGSTDPAKICWLKVDSL